MASSINISPIFSIKQVYKAEEIGDIPFIDISVPWKKTDTWKDECYLLIDPPPNCQIVERIKDKFKPGDPQPRVLWGPRNNYTFVVLSIIEKYYDEIIKEIPANEKTIAVTEENLLSRDKAVRLQALISLKRKLYLLEGPQVGHCETCD